MSGPASPERLITLLGGARVASGVAFIALSGPLGRLLIGKDADSAGAQLFIRAFGARDVLLGAGGLLAMGSLQPARPWLMACGLADAFDAAATVAGYRRLPAKRRALTFAASAIPALVNLSATRWLADASRSAGWRSAGSPRGGDPDRLAD